MKRILVLVKQVPTSESVRLNEETGTMIRTGTDAAMNPLDLHAVEAAVRIAETSDQAIVITALSMGPPQAASALREALALGCDEGILLSDPAFAGADTWATAYTLVRGIRTLGDVDLILCGERATDGETGQVGPMVAAMLEWPVLTYASRLEVCGDELQVGRAIEGGMEQAACPLPAVVCILRDLNDPRLPTLSGKIRAHEAALRILGASDIEADSAHLGLGGSPTRVVNVTYPSFRRRAELLDARQDGIEAAIVLMQRFLGIEETGA